MTCPLCAVDFENAGCPPACPLSHGCAMMRCPRCGYEFVEDGPLAKWVRRIFKRRTDHAAPTRG
jgi:hypothetical protein